MSTSSAKVGAITAAVVLIGLYVVSNMVSPSQHSICQCPQCPRCPDCHCEVASERKSVESEPPVADNEGKSSGGECTEDEPTWNMEEFISHIPAQHQDKCRKWLKDGSDAKMYAQFRQDWFIYNNYFLKNKGRPYGEGFYVDVGANDPSALSNTLFFDRCLGWKGVCVEPNPIYAPGYAKHRSCELVPNCVYKEHKSLYFDLPGASTKGTAGRILNCTDDEPCEDKHIGAVRKVLCLTLDEILANVSQKIDLLSVDVEGNEIDVLETFPFEKHDIQVVTIEMNKSPQNKMAYVMSEGGFYKDASVGIDDVFVKRRKPMRVPSDWPSVGPYMLRYHP